MPRCLGPTGPMSSRRPPVGRALRGRRAATARPRRGHRDAESPVDRRPVIGMRAHRADLLAGASALLDEEPPVLFIWEADRVEPRIAAGPLLIDQSVEMPDFLIRDLINRLLQ